MTDAPVPAAASPVASPLDPERVSADFPILAVGPNTGKRLAYLDSAASAMKPRQVIDAIRDVYEGAYANVHRGVYAHAATATDNFEAAREAVRELLNARSPREVIFTRGTTEAINLVAYAWGRTNLGPGDIVVTTELEHHSNLVPWQQACLATGAELRFIPVDDDGILDVSGLEALAEGGRLRMVAVVHVSNSLGTHVPLDVIVPWAKSHDALVLVDGAQSVPHRVVDVQALGIDFLAFSAHKLMGPTGAGALWGREELLAEMPPWQFGGEMIRRVGYDSTTFNDLPWKFEAGTPNMSGAVGLAAAIDYLEDLGAAAVHAHEQRLLAQATTAALEVPGLRVIGTAADKAAVLSFTIEGIHPHDLGTILDSEGVAIRTGHHCAMPVMDFFGLPATARASFACYNDDADVSQLIGALHKAREVFA